MRSSAYEVLGVPSDASQRDITVAYRLLARQNHHDVEGSDPERIREINAAYNRIKTPALRRAYDWSRRTYAATCAPPRRVAKPQPVSPRTPPNLYEPLLSKRGLKILGAIALLIAVVLVVLVVIHWAFIVMVVQTALVVLAAILVLRFVLVK